MRRLAFAPFLFGALVLGSLPATGQGMATTTPVVLQAVDGSELAGSLTVPAGAPNRLALLVTHGAGGNYQSSVPGWMSREAARYGYVVLSLNRRDHDDRNERTTFEDGLSDLRVGVDYLAGLGYDQVVLVGHSKGTTYLPTYVVAMGDRRVVAIVLLGAVDDSALQQRLIVQRGVFDQNLARAEAAYAAGQADEVLDFSSAFGQPIRLTPRGFLSYFGPDSLGVPVRMIRLVTTPVLLLRSSSDTQFTPDENHRRILEAGRAAGVAVEYVTIPDPDPTRSPALGHGFVGVEAATMEALANWLDRVFPAARQPRPLRSGG
jgi:dipeptidyl aminopeptidase/acylaminoacyl peptidase